MGKIFCVGNEWEKDLNNHFIEMYDSRFWLNKIKTYEILLNNSEEFVEKYEDSDLNKDKLDNYKNFLKSEIVFTFYHITECLFILIMGIQHTKIPWVQISEIKTSHIKEYIEKEIKSKNFDNKRIRFTFYNQILEEKNKDKIEKIKNSCDKIQDYLIRISEIYLKQEIYQSFKHGLRVMGGQSSFGMFPEGKEEKEPIISGSGDSFTYLDLKLIKKEKPANKKQQLYYKIEKVTEMYDFELFLEMCKINYKLIANMMDIRKQLHKKKKELGDKVYDNPIEINLNFFDELDLKEIFQIKKGGITRFAYSRND